MNVLHILPSSHIGGSELCVYETVKVLQAEGFQNYAIFPQQGSMVAYLSEHLAGHSVVQNSWWIAGGRWSAAFKLKMLRGYFLSAWKIKKYIKKHSIDIVITHTLAIPAGALGAWMANVPHVWYIHEYGDRDHGFNFVYGKQTTLKMISKLSHSVVFNSKTVADYFSEFITQPKRYILNSVIEYPLTAPLVRKDKNSLKICIVGRISPGKNQLIIVEALALLKQKNIFPLVTFIGGANPDYLSMLKEKVHLNGLGNQVGFVEHTQAPWEYVQKADCVVVSSKMEAFGRVTIEGMKSGKILVVSNTGAGTELIHHGVTGYLFSPENVRELANILEMIWNMEDVEFITKAGYEFASENFNTDKHKQQIMLIINSI